jgi:hypothetical protein
LVFFVELALLFGIGIHALLIAAYASKGDWGRSKTYPGRGDRLRPRHCCCVILCSSTIADPNTDTLADLWSDTDPYQF